MEEDEPDRTAEVFKDRLADWIHRAWARYEHLFGEPPHGTQQQIRSMLEFGQAEFNDMLAEYLKRAR